jgi:molybdopterin-guanine dinucleotide biosynthesis protein A
MGFPKALLPFGDEVLLERVVRALGEVVAPVVVVAAAGQDLPPLRAGVLMATDERPERGPLEGMAAGLAEIGGRADAVYVTSCDVPLLAPLFVRRMIDTLGEADIAVPVEEQEGKTFHHPLAGVYRMSVLPVIRQLLGEDQLRPVFLFDKVATRRVDVDKLRGVDPELLSLRNVNRPQEYLEAARAGGVAVPVAVGRRLGGG